MVVYSKVPSLEYWPAALPRAFFRQALRFSTGRGQTKQKPRIEETHCMPAVIFDLDNCLMPASEVDAGLFAPAFEAIAAANDGSVAAEAMQKAFADIWLHAYDWVARQYCFTPAMFAAGWAEFARAEVTRPLKGYADLSGLETIPAERFLVTSGFRRLQESKIRALGISHLFKGIYIDAIDEPDRKGKRAIFQDIVERNQYGLHEALVVGDNPASEIQAGNELGLGTIQILRPGISRSPKAKHHIESLLELPALLSAAIK